MERWKGEIIVTLFLPILLPVEKKLPQPLCILQVAS